MKKKDKETYWSTREFSIALIGVDSHSAEITSYAMVHDHYSEGQFDVIAARNHHLIYRRKDRVMHEKYAQLFAGYAFENWQIRYWKLASNGATKTKIRDWLACGLQKLLRYNNPHDFWDRDFLEIRLKALFQAIEAERDFEKRKSQILQEKENAIRSLKSKEFQGQSGLSIKRRELEQTLQHDKRRIKSDRAIVFQFLEAQKTSLLQQIAVEKKKAKKSAEDTADLQEIMSLVIKKQQQP